MTREQLINLGLSQEAADKALSLYTEEMKSFVPRARLGEETEKAAALQERLGGMEKELEAFKTEAEKGTALRRQLSDLRETYQAETAALTRQISQTRLDAALDTAILQERGRNPKAIKALIDLEALSLGENGEIQGLDLAEVRASAPYLFETETVSIEGTGAAGSGGFFPGEDDPSQMSMSEYKAWRERQL
ncbi:MAG: phage scaffolding protein [Oscillospiraceae bacterium]|nr:phage scaffolding protein [Oscillospiraceae bacterium]